MWVRVRVWVRVSVKASDTMLVKDLEMGLETALVMESGERGGL